MLDAVKVCGRWFSTHFLSRFNRLVRLDQTSSRAELVERFCYASGWLDALGRPCTGTASVGLARLEKQGLLTLPPPQARKPRKAPRSLPDDGQPLPALPRLPQNAGMIQGLRLHLVENTQDPKNPLWNRLISREHPLRSQPLVGTQLRYLLECDAGVIGAFGFGPPAFHLACRDLWIGWSACAREAHRPRVIGLSRFLIRLGVRCQNLASCSYAMILKRVASDWEERYGIRPLLVETYVDRQNHNGRSLAASNWRRLGQSTGRGRNDRQGQKLQSIKDVWVYELERAARSELQCLPPEQIVPRSVFALEGSADWTDSELDELSVGHKKLAQRTRRMLADRWARPGASFYASFGGKTGGKAAYKWVENQREELQFESVLKPHLKQTARRMAAEKVVLLAQDTTTLNYSGLEQTQGLGSTDPAGSRGLFLHTLLAFRLDAIPLGVAWAEVWARPAVSDTDKRDEQSVADKESGRWLRAFQAAAQRAIQMPQTQLIVCGDRESDIFELYDQCEAAPENLHVLARGKHDRLLSNGQRLWDHLETQPLGGRMNVAVPRRQNQPARQATLEIRWAQIQIQPPSVALKKSWPNLKMFAVLAREVGNPKGVEPIEWVLLTDCEVTSLKMAIRMVLWYGLRWGIECWHRVLKVGCGVEKRQFRTARALTRSLALDMIVADRVLLMVRLGKDHPDLPASVVYTPEEVRLLEVLKEKAPIARLLDRPANPPLAQSQKTQSSKKGVVETSQSEESLALHAEGTSGLTIFQANLILASLTGSWCRRADKHPGAQTVAEGLRVLHLLIWYERLHEPPPPQRGNPRAGPT